MRIITRNKAERKEAEGMFNIGKLDETIEKIEDDIIEKGSTAEMVSALASLIQARALVQDRLN